MARSFREFIESVVFAGLKPGATSGQSPSMQWLGRLREPLERFLSPGPAPTDPLYLSSRTPWQRLQLAMKIAIPFVLVGGIAVFVFRSSIFPKNQPKLDLTAAELAARMLPDINKIKIEANKDIEVPYVGIDRSGSLSLVGTIQNNTTRKFSSVDVLFELTDENGSKLGGVTARVENVAPQSRSGFKVPIQQTRAAIVLVRNIQTQ